MNQFKACVENYISKWQPCPCHPAESEIALGILKKVVDGVVKKSLAKLIRELLDDDLILSEEIITDAPRLG